MKKIPTLRIQRASPNQDSVYVIDERCHIVASFHCNRSKDHLHDGKERQSDPGINTLAAERFIEFITSHWSAQD